MPPAPIGAKSSYEPTRSGKESATLATDAEYTITWFGGFDMIRFEKLSVSYDGRTKVLTDLSLTVERGELVVLLGVSGSGKSTALRSVNRLVLPDAGRVLVDDADVAGRDVIELRRSIGYVLQRFGLFPHRTVAENVATVPRLLSWKPAEITARVDELLLLVGLEPATYRERFPGQLSGGQQQRVGVARALAARPAIMLLDEPFGALDPVTRSSLQLEYEKIHCELGLTTLLVTHDVSEALSLADKIAILANGKLAQLGTPKQIVNEPASDEIARFVHTPLEQLDLLAKLRGTT
jgi:osmoprotectant transport system ATP-binding protein